MHDDIKRFSLDGEIGDANVVEAKERMVYFLESQMRDGGYVPALDLEPQFTRTYDSGREVYGFELTVYGIYVGRNKSWLTAGIIGGKTVSQFTPQVRSNRY